MPRDRFNTALLVSRLSASLLLTAALCALPAAAQTKSDIPDLSNLPLKIHFYGFLNAEVEWARALGGATPFTPRMRVADGSSRLGLTGSYDLTGDTSVTIQLEGYLNNFEQGGVDDLGNSATLESRNSFVALKDKRFGDLLVGYYDNAYRALVGTGSSFGGNFQLTSLGLDLWNNTSAAMSGGPQSLFGRGEARLKNSVHYFSPELVNLRLALSYGFDETLSNGGRRDHYSAALLWSWSGLKIGAGYDHQANTGVDGDSLQLGYGFQTTGVNDVSTNFYKGIISYEAPWGTYVGFGYERSVYGYNDFDYPQQGQLYNPIQEGNMSQGGAMLSLAQRLADLTFMLSLGKLGNLSNSIVGGGKEYASGQISVGAKYAFNRSFMAYVYFTRIDNNALQNLNLGTPVYSNKLGTSGAFLAPGDKPMTGGTGMLARF